MAQKTATTTKTTAPKATTTPKTTTEIKVVKTIGDSFKLLESLTDSVHGNTALSKYKPQLAAVKSIFEDEILKYEKRIKELNEIIECQNGIQTENEQLKAEINRRQDTTSTLVSLKEKNEELENKNKMLNDEIIKIKASKFDELTSTKVSYSSMARNNNQKPRQKSVNNNKPNFNLIISPIEEEKIQNSNQTLNIFNDKVNIDKIITHGIRIMKQKPINRKKVLVKCETPEDINNIRKIIENDSNIRADIPKSKNPRVQIIGIPKFISKSEILECIKAQNPNIRALLENSSEELKFIFEKDDRVGTKFAILEATPNTWRNIVESGRIYIGNAACIAKEKITVMQCYNCYRFGHRARDCRNSETCGKCAGEHQTKNCQNNRVKCTNCSWHNSLRKNVNHKHDENHMATSFSCPRYIAATNKAQSMTNYA